LLALLALLGGNSALISKGLRRIGGGNAAADAKRQFSPDFKGIETGRGTRIPRLPQAAIQP